MPPTAGDGGPVLTTSAATPTCGVESLVAGAREPEYAEQTRQAPGRAPVVTVVTRVRVQVAAACLGVSWRATLAPAGGPARVLAHTGATTSAGPYAVGEELVVTLSWRGPADLRRTTRAVLTVNGAAVPLTLRGWRGGPATWSGPVRQSAVPHA